MFLLVSLALPRGAKAEVRVLTLNAWNNGDRVLNGQEKLIAQILRSRAHVVLLQEADRVAAELAARTGMQLVSFGTSTAILSRFPVEERFRFEKSVGAVVRVEGLRMGVVSVHFTAFPYGPYLACFEGKSDEEVLKEEERLRLREASTDLVQVFSQIQGTASLIVGGDLNTPSYLDWIERTRDEHCGRAIEFPVTKLFERHGLKDSYRVLHPDPLASPGNTWSPVEKHNGMQKRPEPQDRLDMIHYSGPLSPRSADVFLDELNRWPSDHASVLVELSLFGPESSSHSR